MAWTLDKILRGARKLSASDIHLVRGVAPVVRINGEIQFIQGEPLEEEALRQLVEEVLPPKQRKVFEEQWKLCFSRHFPGVGRCRTSLYYHGGCPEMAIRLCETSIRPSAELGLPPIIGRIDPATQRIGRRHRPYGRWENHDTQLHDRRHQSDAACEDCDHRGSG
jgi:twitching motility protein PilT